MNTPITATRPRTLGGCLQCAAGIAHTRHDTALPAATRTTITAAIPLGDPDLPGYGETDRWPAI